MKFIRIDAPRGTSAEWQQLLVPAGRWVLAAEVKDEANSKSDRVQALSSGHSDQGDPEGLLKVREVCALIGCSKSQTYALIGNEDLKSVRIGKRGVRVKRQSVIEFISNGGVCIDETAVHASKVREATRVEGASSRNWRPASGLALGNQE